MVNTTLHFIRNWTRNTIEVLFFSQNDVIMELWRHKWHQFTCDFNKFSKISSFCRLKIPNIWISMFSYVENRFLMFLELFEAFLTSYDAIQRQKRRQFMYDFKKITKISSFCYLKIANIWISMFSYAKNPFLRFLRLIEAFMTSYDATKPLKRCQYMYDFDKILKSWVFYVIWKWQIYGF